MKKAKDINDSLEFLRSFEKHANETELGELVLQKLDHHSKSLSLQGSRLTETDFQKLFSKNTFSSGMKNKSISVFISNFSEWVTSQSNPQLAAIP